ncbi:unnamed protein product [Parnassius mnemosyne]|uniref:Uncharacterized protein n=1 Tax=Parnassius mnemosyne TaxID=213953 RepID=A0AAV1LVC9_9NEOP
MVQCKKCKQYVSLSKDEVIKCKGSCESVFHKKCVRNLKKHMQKEICEECQKNESPERISKPMIDVDLSKTSVEMLLGEVNKKLEIIYKMERSIEELKDTVDFYAEQYQSIIEFKEEAERKIKSLENKNTYLEKCNKAMEERILEIEQREKENNIEIAGLEMQNNEQILEVVNVIAEKYNLCKADIVDVKRVGRPKPERTKPQPVIVTLRSRSARDKWLSLRKTTLTNDHVYGNKSKSSIYINEDLPKYKRQLFWTSKNELKQIYKYIWIQNSNILVKKENETKIHRISCEKDIQNLKA